MSDHTLIGRTDDEVLWFRRRGFLKAAAAWTAMGGAPAALAQQRSNVVEWQGDILLNGVRMPPNAFVQSGDQIQTGPGSTLIFVIGNSSFLVRQNSFLTVERGSTLNAVSVLRMVTGAVAGVFGSGRNRQIVMPTLTAGIRGTGVYAEVFPQQRSRSYFCNCYGVVDVAAGGERMVSQADYHQSFWGEPEPKDGRLLTPARAINHTDEELEQLAGLLNLRTAWQIAGRRGNKEGTGYMDPQPHTMHPLMQQQQPAVPAQPVAPR